MQSTNGSIAVEMRQIEKESEVDAESENSAKLGFFELAYLMVKNHPKKLILVLLARVYTNSMWYTNLYEIQKNNVSVDSEDSPSIFWNGIYFSAMDAFSLFVGGGIGKNF
jgi:hypothetical protein